MKYIFDPFPMFFSLEQLCRTAGLRIRRDFFDVRDGFQVIRYGIYEYTLIAIAITGTTIIIEYFVSIFTAGCWSLELTNLFPLK